MNRRRVRNSLVVAGVIVAVGIPLVWQARQMQLNGDLRGAIRQDKPERVRALLAQGADPNAVGPPQASVESWKQQIDRLLGRSKESESATALGIAIGMNVSGDPGIDAHWNPAVISVLLAHGAVLNPSDPSQPWGDLKGWTIDTNGLGMTYIQHFQFAPGAKANPTGIGHIHFSEKRQGEPIISAFRKAGLKRG